MIKVKDVSGAIVRGVYRDKNGTLLVKDDDLLTKYKNELAARQRDQDRIKDLESTVDSLKQMVLQLLESKK